MDVRNALPYRGEEVHALAGMTVFRLSPLGMTGFRMDVNDPFQATELVQRFPPSRE